MRRALFVTYGGGHVNMVIPVARELARRGGWRVDILGLTTAGAVLRDAGLPSLGFRDLVRPEDAGALRRAAHALKGSVADQEVVVAKTRELVTANPWVR